MKVLTKDQCLEHAQFGVGVVKSADTARTVVDFYEHGLKTFITSMLQGQLLAEAPARPSKSKKAAAARKKKTKTTDQ